ncbi:hypothetical protein LEP1GSC133_3460 [Leptospira borgpetersenii serovar Pomona str. 200901868]|uniref:Uncharacterized protein n=2 Tax=Leptospira borgpetersenii TaxID=174 RepID=M3H226_LEPBO|nr:hypothetical protein LEP1GSC123_0984 [Leptospira borgpetersenii str. 200701203]EMO63118.1 hypothetical protein LEP1GSC133_3460 [Leptospira borgpetersenii serovar Pomona str. 200901868]
MLKICIIPIFICFSLGVFAEKVESDRVLIKKNIIKRRKRITIRKKNPCL